MATTYSRKGRVLTINPGYDLGFGNQPKQPSSGAASTGPSKVVKIVVIVAVVAATLYFTHGRK